VLHPACELAAQSDIGFVWVCFFVPPNKAISHIILLLKSLRYFAYFEIGFVFSNYAL
jgi:hypothetical protein